MYISQCVRDSCACRRRRVCLHGCGQTGIRHDPAGVGSTLSRRQVHDPRKLCSTGRDEGHDYTGVHVSTDQPGPMRKWTTKSTPQGKQVPMEISRSTGEDTLKGTEELKAMLPDLNGNNLRVSLLVSTRNRQSIVSHVPLKRNPANEAQRTCPVTVSAASMFQLDS